MKLKQIEYGDIFKLPLLDGLIMEFGVASGATFRQFAGMIGGRKIYGFDCFTGLPEPWAGHSAGSFAVLGYENLQWPANSELVPGLFQDTLAGFLETHPGPVAYAHIDCDLYSSAKCVLDNLAPRIVTGSILHFDEIRTHLDSEHEIRAFNEYLAGGSEWEIIGCVTPNDAVFKRTN